MMVKSNKKKRRHENSGMPPSLVKLPPQFFSMIAKFYSSLQRIEDWFGCFPFPIAICIYPPILIVFEIRVAAEHFSQRTLTIQKLCKNSISI